MKKIIILFIALLAVLLLIGSVSAEQVTLRVDSKHVVGSGLGNSPLDMDECINVVYVIAEVQRGHSAAYITQEYPVSITDYCKIKLGQTVTLECPGSRLDAWKIVSIK